MRGSAILFFPRFNVNKFGRSGKNRHSLIQSFWAIRYHQSKDINTLLRKGRWCMVLLTDINAFLLFSISRMESLRLGRLGKREQPNRIQTRPFSLENDLKVWT